MSTPFRSGGPVPVRTRPLDRLRRALLTGLRRAGGAIGLAAAFAAACTGGDTTAPRGDAPAQLVISANLTGTTIRTLSVTVTAADLPRPVVSNIQAVLGPNGEPTGVATGTITVPPGAARTITVRGFDVTGQVTYEGATTLDVRSGTNPGVSVVLLPVAGTVPITVTVAGLRLAVTPATITLAPGATAQLTAAVTNASGTVLESQTVTWASTNPAIATVSATGLVTAGAGGTATIVATVTGVTAEVAITVTGGAPSVVPVQVASSGYHACALTAAGAAYCWGANGFGQLGDGTTIDRASAVPVQMPAGTTFVQIAANEGHTCAVAASGDAWCWGWNSSGALGAGTIGGFRTTPVLVQAPAGVRFTKVVTGNSHTCGLAIGGQAYCWGNSSFLQTGRADMGSQAFPGAVEVPPGLTFTDLSAGFTHTCGVTAAGVAYCWGDNAAGQLGIGEVGLARFAEQVQAPGGVSFVAVKAGRDFTCGLDRAGSVYCWGINERGQLGDGTTSARTLPVRAATPLGQRFEQVETGDAHACGRTTAGSAYCWGLNNIGQLGDNSTENRATPTVVASPEGVAFAGLAAAYGHSCGVTSGRVAYCWGWNANGQLGDGTSISRSIPTRVTGFPP